jgi:hypothetical protein
MSNTNQLAKEVTGDQTSYKATIRNAETTVIVSDVGVSVYVRNESSRAWSRCGYGKHFGSIAKAIEGYKSAPMKSFLQSIKHDQEPSNVIQFA